MDVAGTTGSDILGSQGAATNKCGICLVGSYFLAL